jgi:hypothetical protein
MRPRQPHEKSEIATRLGEDTSRSLAMTEERRHFSVYFNLGMIILLNLNSSVKVLQMNF